MPICIVLMCGEFSLEVYIECFVEYGGGYMQKCITHPIKDFLLKVQCNVSPNPQHVELHSQKI